MASIDIAARVVGTLEAEPALVQQDDGVAEPQVADRVRDQHDRLVQGVGEVLEPDHELVLGVGIEAAGQLVEQEEGRSPMSSSASAMRRIWPPESVP